MKLLYCPFCNDVRKLSYQKQSCSCGLCYGKYLPDGLNAEVSENARVIGILNSSLREALRLPDREDGLGNTITAFVIPSVCDTVKWVK